MHELEYQSHPKSPEEVQKKFYKVDQIQDDPVPCHTYDPIHQSPIPRKRNVSESQARRSSIDQARSMFQSLDHQFWV